MISSRDSLRKQIRDTRNQLSEQQQHEAAQDLVSSFLTLPELKSSQHIALYLSNDGELSTQPLVEKLWQLGKHTYLPILHPFSKGNLLFLHYDANTPLVTNRYGIWEPKLSQPHIKPVSQLDLIATPLVGFDALGNRLGMGGGYYDRTLENWRNNESGPYPIGIAHDCQQVDSIPVQAWDVPLAKIVTPSKIWHWDG
ncbi:5-formyltetrahydrofolate cyclo-ligase [Vibrio sp. S4M6]|uniref:5-formyltetrahydrofolate cyclo-ligase n=1 Tax=Vibrio sinus TaxID=2946865 RepID=UPI00202AABBD|nr:5-formyltetrahydrofolate cyclo-ligase [Vibrio sinus]MCL9781565.1 5-formyltetrahydrofolate cyclo-ligase [Vibrio sinus]